MARLAHQLAVLNRRVTADVIEISEYVDLATKYQVTGVPKTIINDLVEVDGAVPESRFLDAIMTALETADAKALSQPAKKKKKAP